MRLFLILFSLLWIALGATIVLHTGRARGRLKEMILGVNVRLWAALAVLLGMIFLVAAFAVQEVFWLALVLGILALAKGVYFAVSPLQQVRSLLEWWSDRATETTIRLWGLVSFTLGVMLLSWLM
ncbi:MAG: hypothetical protein GX422_15025 [Deltaproteobacteria bacterium]|nr:hypothetical protein [Deltaproteobacteria bacterium]